MTVYYFRLLFIVKIIFKFLGGMFIYFQILPVITVKKSGHLPTRNAFVTENYHMVHFGTVSIKIYTAE